MLRTPSFYLGREFALKGSSQGTLWLSSPLWRSVWKWQWSEWDLLHHCRAPQLSSRGPSATTQVCNSCCQPAVDQTNQTGKRECYRFLFLLEERTPFGLLFKAQLRTWVAKWPKWFAEVRITFAMNSQHGLGQQAIISQPQLSSCNMDVILTSWYKDYLKKSTLRKCYPNVKYN